LEQAEKQLASLLKIGQSKELRKMRRNGKKSKIAIFVSVGVAGGVTGVAVGFAAATDLSPVLTGLLAGLLSALLGTVTFMVALRLVGE
jgi:phage shock protein PspC (stress-responsive transcriptional regulator)